MGCPFAVSGDNSGALRAVRFQKDNKERPSKMRAQGPEIGDKMPDGTIFAGISPDTGKPMYATPEDAPLRMEWQKAMNYAASLDAHGHEDWRLPSRAELNVLFNNQAAIGGFKTLEAGRRTSLYWSSTERGTQDAWFRCFGGRLRPASYIKYMMINVRCIRTG